MPPRGRPGAGTIPQDVRSRGRCFWQIPGRLHRSCSSLRIQTQRSLRRMHGDICTARCWANILASLCHPRRRNDQSPLIVILRWLTAISRRRFSAIPPSWHFAGDGCGSGPAESNPWRSWSISRAKIRDGVLWADHQPKEQIFQWICAWTIERGRPISQRRAENLV